MRGSAEVQRAHDVILSVLLQQTSVRLTAESELLLLECAGVLCWALDEEPDHHGSFGLELVQLERELEARGDRLPDARRSGTGDDARRPGSMEAT